MPRRNNEIVVNFVLKVSAQEVPGSKEETVERKRVESAHVYPEADDHLDYIPGSWSHDKGYRGNPDRNAPGSRYKHLRLLLTATCDAQNPYACCHC